MGGIDTGRRRYVRGLGLVVGTGMLSGCLDGMGPDLDPDDDTADPATDGVEDEPEPEDDPPTDDEDDADDDAEDPDDEVADDEVADDPDDDADRNGEPSEVIIRIDAGEVTGTIYGSGECGVVLTPQINMDRASWEDQAVPWAEAGMLVLAIDPVEDHAPASVVAAVDYLRDEGVEAVVLVGASIGGEASVRAAADRPDLVAGVVALSPGGGEDRAGELTGEKLFVVAEDDRERFVETTRAMYEGADEPKDLVEYESDAHGQRLFGTEHAPDLLERINALLADACP